MLKLNNILKLVSSLNTRPIIARQLSSVHNLSVDPITTGYNFGKHDFKIFI